MYRGHKPYTCSKLIKRITSLGPLLLGTTTSAIWSKGNTQKFGFRLPHCCLTPWRGGVKQQWGNRKRGFLGFRTLCLQHFRKWGQQYYIVLFSPLSPFHWPQNTWPWMTLNGLNGHFTLNYYELTLKVLWLREYYLLIYCRVCLPTRDQQRSGKRSSGPWSAEYLESAENCRSFVDATSSES